MHSMLPYLASSYSRWSQCTTMYLSPTTKSSNQVAATAITQESTRTTSTPSGAIISPSQPTLARPCAWTFATGLVASPSFKPVRLQAKLAHLAGPCRRVAKKEEERVEGAWEWEENLFVAEEEDDLGDSESCTSDDSPRSSPPSPIFDTTSPVTTSTTTEPLQEPQPPTPKYTFARVLFDDDEAEETDSLSSLESAEEEEEEEEQRFNYTCRSFTGTGLHLREEDDDDSYFAELPIFADSPSPPLLIPFATPTTSTKTFNVAENLSATAQPELTASPNPFLSSSPALASPPLAVPDGFALDFVVVSGVEEDNWECQDAGDESSDDGYYDDPPCFLSPAPIPSPSQLAYLSPEVEIEEDEEDLCEYLSESFVHLPSLRVLHVAPRERGVPDWRDWLRRDAIARSAHRQGLPWIRW
ncbi:hypothetical protein BCR35DRAFT_307501 [Leucosporidium creatinivorum]|uniref:Uncharacterized protein n=1 Tax=Leucosporidium creatinivorum TaxID=106004 RepID=A0A1Y2ENB9_9BASI|nr:hypothetical protein BCR35DRAFT_307501 [Leucosporidium creatinivorum]